jgi:two-component system sensor histidine kinase AgrC
MQTKIQNLILENKKSKQIIDTISIFKHDYSNILCSIGGYIALNDMNGLKKFYSKLTEDLYSCSTMQKINTTSINEPSIYNIFASKYKIILKNNLKFDFYSTINYKKLYISPYELSKILGIFLDNAIEASCLSTEKEISVTCETLKNKNQQIIIKNSYSNKDVDINKIYLKGNSSKNIKSGLRLMGSF